MCVCLFVAGGRAGGVRTFLQPARAQCLRLSERFFHRCIVNNRPSLYIFFIFPRNRGATDIGDVLKD